AAGVRRVVFDKTGTLTMGTLRVANPDVLVRLDREELYALREMTARSAHPKSQAIARILPLAALDRDVEVVEVPGRGVELGQYRLGSPSFAGASAGHDVVFSKNGIVRAGFVTEEELRPDAKREIARLGRESWILSGDSLPRAIAVANACNIPVSR